MRVNPRAIAHIKNRYIRALYPYLRSVPQCKQELQWLKQELPTSRDLLTACRLRGRGYPLQYVLGTQPFGDLTIQCRPGVLIPRWETEEWTMELSKLVSSDVRGVDLCTGTGCIMFSLENAGMQGVAAVDVSPKAQSVYELNKSMLHCKTPFLLHDITNPLPSLKCDLVTANPPYIMKSSDRDWGTHFEPDLALFGDKPILRACVDRIIELDSRAAVIEIGSQSQIEFLMELFETHGWDAHGKLDGAGRPRTVWAWKGRGFLS